MPEHFVGKVVDLPPGQGCVCRCGDQDVAVFNVGGRFHAIHNACPHLEGSLGRGRLEGTVVTCPAHLWRVDVTTGRCLEDARSPVATLRVTVRGGELFVDVPEGFVARPPGWGTDPGRCWDCGCELGAGGELKHHDTPLGPVCRRCAG